MKQAEIYPVVTLISQNLTGNGTNTDCTGVSAFDAEGVLHIVNVGNSADTLSGSLYFSLILQHSNDGTNYDAVDDALHVVNGTGSSFNASTGAFAVIDDGAEDSLIVAIHYVGPRPYSRVRIARTGNNASGTPTGAIAVKSHLRKQPG